MTATRSWWQVLLLVVQLPLTPTERQPEPRSLSMSDTAAAVHWGTTGDPRPSTLYDVERRPIGTLSSPYVRVALLARLAAESGKPLSAYAVMDADVDPLYGVGGRGRGWWYATFPISSTAQVGDVAVVVTSGDHIGRRPEDVPTASDMPVWVGSARTLADHQLRIGMGSGRYVIAAIEPTDLKAGAHVLLQSRSRQTRSFDADAVVSAADVASWR